MLDFPRFFHDYFISDQDFIGTYEAALTATNAVKASSKEKHSILLPFCKFLKRKASPYFCKS